MMTTKMLVVVVIIIIIRVVLRHDGVVVSVLDFRFKGQCWRSHLEHHVVSL